VALGIWDDKQLIRCGVISIRVEIQGFLSGKRNASMRFVRH